MSTTGEKKELQKACVSLSYGLRSMRMRPALRLTQAFCNSFFSLLHFIKPRSLSCEQRFLVKSLHRKESGQLAVGLAFSFLTILAMFALVFQSSLLTREKMKLQQTTDLAALAGAEVQRQNLNRIIRINGLIKDSYELLVAGLNSKPCALYFQGGGVTNLGVLIGVGAKLNTKVDVCETACEQIEQAQKKKLLEAYERGIEQLQAQIFSSILETNVEAQTLAETVMLNYSNLPLRLRQVAEKSFGKNVKAKEIQKSYQNGEFNNQISIFNVSKDRILFEPKSEQLKVLYTNSSSATAVVTTGTLPNCQYLPIGKPHLVMVPGKVGRVGPLNTSFFTGAIVNYSGLKSVVESDLNIFLKNPHSEKHEKLSDGTGNGDAKLFQSRMQMSTLALAKPYGGEYPVPAGLISNILGSPGKKFEGVKLIGFADDEEQGLNIFRGETLGFGDPNSQEKIEIDLGAEVLH